MGITTPVAIVGPIVLRLMITRADAIVAPSKVPPMAEHKRLYYVYMFKWVHIEMNILTVV